MYAVIRAGGKQYKVAKGDIIEVERIKESETVEFTPLLVVDDKGKVRSGRTELNKAVVTARVLGEGRGPKLDIYKFRNKSGYRRHTGHRQTYSRLEISGIKLSGGESSSKAPAKKTTAKKTTAKKTTAKSSTSKTTKKTTVKSSAESSAKKAPATKSETASKSEEE